MTDPSKHPAEQEALICTNCSGSEMDEVCNPFLTMDPLEWHCFIMTTLAITIAGQRIVGFLKDFFGLFRYTPDVLQHALWALLLIPVFAGISYSVVARLSYERYRRDGICIWYVRCAKCHARFRVVRPYGSVPPWREDKGTVRAEQPSEGPADP